MNIPVFALYVFLMGEWKDECITIMPTKQCYSLLRAGEGMSFTKDVIPPPPVTHSLHPSLGSHRPNAPHLDEISLDSTVYDTPSIAKKRKGPLRKLGRFLLKALMFILDWKYSCVKWQCWRWDEMRWDTRTDRGQHTTRLTVMAVHARWGPAVEVFVCVYVCACVCVCARSVSTRCIPGSLECSSGSCWRHSQGGQHNNKEQGSAHSSQLDKLWWMADHQKVNQHNIT